MKKLWGKLYKNNRMIGNFTSPLNGAIDEDGFFEDLLDTVSESLVEICEAFDIENPLWLDSNRDEFMRRSKTVFKADSFMDDIKFDRLEIEIIE